MRVRLMCALATVALPLLACTPAPPLIEATTRLGATSDTAGPYVVHSVVIGVDGEAVELNYSVDDARRFIPVPMLAADDEESFRGEIPGQPAGSVISYYVAVLRDGEQVASDPDAAGAGPYVFAVE